MKQPIEVIKFSRIALDRIQIAMDAVIRAEGHLRRVHGSFHKAVEQRYIVGSGTMAHILVSHSDIQRLFAQLDETRAALVEEQKHYEGRIKEATTTLGLQDKN